MWAAARAFTRCGWRRRATTVHLIDPTPKHVAQARAASAAQPAHPLAGAEIGDARALQWADASVDAVLLLGPLYHLPEREERVQAWREARRVVRDGGFVVAAAISRFASTLDGLFSGFLDDPVFVRIAHEDVRSGQHRNPDQHPGYFTTAYFHHPEELKCEIAYAGLHHEATLPVEGVGWHGAELRGALAGRRAARAVAGGAALARRRTVPAWGHRASPGDCAKVKNLAQSRRVLWDFRFADLQILRFLQEATCALLGGFVWDCCSSVWRRAHRRNRRRSASPRPAGRGTWCGRMSSTTKACPIPKSGATKSATSATTSCNTTPKSATENARVEDGTLIIEARKDGDTVPGADRGYTSASLVTKDTATWTYGRIEVRAKLPQGVGTWPAIWTLGVNIDEVGWPACGEIDIMEHVGFAPGLLHGTVHTEAYNHVKGTARGGSLYRPDPYEDFHIYAVEWFEDHIDFYIDEYKYFTFKNENAGVDAWPYDAPQYLILNLAIGGSWGGQQGVDDSIFPQPYFIDYVRVFSTPKGIE